MATFALGRNGRGSNERPSGEGDMAALRYAASLNFRVGWLLKP